jgi:hypothetical protein
MLFYISTQKHQGAIAPYTYSSIRKIVRNGCIQSAKEFKLILEVTLLF